MMRVTHLLNRGRRKNPARVRSTNDRTSSLAGIDIQVRTPVFRNLVIGWCVVFLGSCTSSAPRVALQVFVHPYAASLFDHPTVGQNRLSEPSSALDAAPRVEMTSAANETNSFVLAFQTDSDSAIRADLDIEPLVGPEAIIDAANVEAFRMHPVTVARWPGWHIRSIPVADRKPAILDVLVPVDAPKGGLVDFRNPGPVILWVDVNVPATAKPGVYRGNLFVTAGRVRVAGVSLELTVLPMVLPNEDAIPVLAELDHRQLFRHLLTDPGAAEVFADDWRGAPNRQEYDGVLRDTLSMLRRHRVTPVLSRWTPPAQGQAAGGLTVDWQLYDRMLSRSSSAGTNTGKPLTSIHAIPFNGIVPLGVDRRAEISPGYKRMLAAYFAEAASHFRQAGEEPVVYLEVPWELPVTPRTVDQAMTIAHLARQADRHIKIMVRGFPQDLAPYGWPDYPHPDLPSVDIWAPPAQFYDPEVMGEERADGRRTWLTLDRPPFSGTLDVRAPESFVCVISWQAAQLGAEVVLAGSINDWPVEASSVVTPQDCVNYAPRTLIYPGTPFGLQEAIPSVRLKRLRRSLQDAAYVQLLRDHGLAHIATALRESLSAYAGTQAYRTHFGDGRAIGWVDEVRWYELARDIMGDALTKAVEGRSAEVRSVIPEQTAKWRRFMLDTRRLRLVVDGVRLRRDASQRQRGWEAQVSVGIFNGRRVPVGGSLRLTAPGWSTAAAETVVEVIAAGEWRRAFLTAVTDAVPLTETGASTFPVDIALADGGGASSAARMALVAALDRPQPIIVDGDLSDWPPGWGNVASDFVPVLTSDVQAGPGDRAPARRDTLVFVLRDEAFLYLGINAQVADRAVAQTTTRNRIEYDDLVPVGEELIELLFDPLNAGTRTPSDLFRIAVKPSGSYRSEKGLQTDPPVGERRPWACDAEVAVRVGGGRWTGEVRVPLASFQAFSTKDTVWGFNITRFDAEAEEFSNWSGATGNPYDPLSLGNLYLP